MSAQKEDLTGLVVGVAGYLQSICKKAVDKRCAEQEGVHERGLFVLF